MSNEEEVEEVEEGRAVGLVCDKIIFAFISIFCIAGQLTFKPPIIVRTNNFISRTFCSCTPASSRSKYHALVFTTFALLLLFCCFPSAFSFFSSIISGSLSSK